MVGQGANKLLKQNKILQTKQTLGKMRFTYAQIPAAIPPPPTATKMASTSWATKKEQSGFTVQIFSKSANSLKSGPDLQKALASPTFLQISRYCLFLGMHDTHMIL